MGKMKVLLVEPMGQPQIVWIDHTLEAMQEIVGGSISCTYPWEDLIGLVYADNGIALGYPLNRALETDGKIYDIVHGTFILCGLTEDSFGDLPDDLAKKYAELFRWPEMYVMTPERQVLQIKLGSGEAPRVV